MKLAAKKAVMKTVFLAFVLPLVGYAQAQPPKPIETDLCVYGGTSGGVAAAIQAARMGKSVVIAEPGKHLGGMTAGGLSAVDIGEPRSVGGIAREYFTKLADTVGVKLAWDKGFDSTAGGPATGGAYAIEPSQAEKLFNDMAHDAGVKVHFNARLASVKKNNARITEFTAEDGTIFRAKMFVDATYEGDLMAKAGVSYTLIREGNAKYGETYNGIHYAPNYQPRTGHLQPGANGRVKGGQGVWDRDFPLDPYVIKGNPKSGLVPLIDQGDPGNSGDPAPGVQAYCFRLCLSTADDRLPILPPSDYDPKRFEIVVRFIEACLANGDDMDLRWFSKYDPLPNKKWDFNTATFGGNLPGASHAWPEANYTQREKIAKLHENYHRGLLHFLATDSRVPEKVRKDMRRFGLPNDEFPDNGGWPHQLYIREARRMISDLVLTEHHTFGRQIAAKSVGLGSYGTDAHEIRRIAKDGVVIREGKISTGRDGFGPYQIGYDAIVPKRNECENLFVTFALSATHSAFASIRMEPVFMVTSQSAATAACLAIDLGTAVQDVEYDKLQTRLNEDGQVLQWSTERNASNSTSKPNGIVLDDDIGEYRGEWISSARLTALVGKGYRHDNNRDQGRKSARFTPEIAKADEYEVRVLYVASENRARNAKVTVHSVNGDSTFAMNQREPALVKGVPRALGRFRFEQGRQGYVELSNEGTDGFVVVDAVQFVPIEIADQERERRIESGFAVSKAEGGSDERSDLAAEVAVSRLTKEVTGKATAAPSSEPIHLANDARAADVNGKNFDFVVIGGTASGIACAVRAAREGCSVLLVQHNRHIGGMLSNGLMQWDALYGGPRSPLMTELLQNIEKDAIARFGNNSKAHQILRYTHEHYPIGWVEPHVMERECHRLVARERNLTLLLEHYPVAVERDEALIKSVKLRFYGTANDIAVKASIFADATYEGDLFALANVPYRVGREARDEYNEPHAGKIFANIDHGPPKSVAVQGLNLRAYTSRQGSIDPTSPFTSDKASQAYNYRLCVSKDPSNRVMIDGPPPSYNRDEFVNFERKSIATNGGPNLKSHMNSPILPGENHAYPEASWSEREKIIERHRNFAIGLIWFLQNDESIPESKRAEFRQWGLAKDEFIDHQHIPYEMYVRESRRIVGRHVITELDGMLSKHYARAPIQPDSIAVTDWYMDSHSCTTDSRPGFKYDGKLILTEESRPMQVPYRALLTQGIHNLLVPVCLSSTHIAWGALRLEPVWMQTGEAAGWAAALSKKHRTTPGKLDPELLLKKLVETRQLVSFFNELKVDADDPRIVAAQYFGTKGFFADYNARLDDRLSENTQALWLKAFDQLRENSLDPSQIAAAIHKAEQTHSSKTGMKRGDFLFQLWSQLRQP